MDFKKKFSENAEQFDNLMTQMLAENKLLKQAINDLIPVLHHWVPDYPEDKHLAAIRNAKNIISLTVEHNVLPTGETVNREQVKA